MILKIIVVGNGIAANFLAGEVKKHELVIVDENEVEHYNRMLLTHFIGGNLSEDVLFRNSVKNTHVEYRLGTRAEKIYPDKKILQTSKGNLNYDTLVIATGARPFVPEIPGIEKAVPLRTFADAKKITGKMGKLIVIGTGYIGLELAGNTSKKSESILVGIEENLLNLSKEASWLLEGELVKMNISIVAPTKIEQIGDDWLKTSSGMLKGTGVVVATGTRSNTELAAKSGLNVNRGIVTDLQFRTSSKDIYAIGDCAEVNDYIGGTGKTAMEQARMLGKVLNGEKIKYSIGSPYNMFKLGSLTVSVIGNTRGESYFKDDSMILYGTEEKPEGAFIMNNPRFSNKMYREISEKQYYV